MNLGPGKYNGMLLLHLHFCDFVSAFRGKGTNTAWPAWEACPKVNPVVKKLGQYSPIIKHADLSILDKFFTTMYDIRTALLATLTR